MLNSSKNIFIIGIKGAAMANLAVILKKMGKYVSGSDLKEEFITDILLLKNKISYSVGFEPENLKENIDLVIYSAAHAGVNNPQAVEAHKRKIPVISQSEILGELMKQFKIKIAVSGCHGKTTTSSLLSYALIQLGKKPSYLVGAPSFNEYAGGAYESDKYFVVEADEYGVNPPTDLRPKFHFLHPDYIICTNIDFDHPDMYKDLENTKEEFLKFFNKKKLILCSDNSNIYQLINRLIQDNYLTYGFSKKADYIIWDVKTQSIGTSFKLSHKNILLGEFFISLFGDKNVSNAAAVIVMLVTLGFTVEKIKKAIGNFVGAKRRFEKVFENDHFSLYDDYGHHPHEIETTILAARKRFPHRRIVIIFQPHTFSRTKIFLKDFGKALSLADYSYILPIFPSAREDSSKFSVTSQDIIKQAPGKYLSYVKDDTQLMNRLHTEVQKGDIMFTIGAGDVYKLKDEIIKLVRSEELEVRDYKEKLNVERNKELFPHLTLRTHTNAEYYVDAKSREELIISRKFATEKKIPFFILGGGSNLAITKKVIKGIVVKNSYQRLEIIEENNDTVDLLVSSGYPVSRLVAETVKKGYEGFEYHKGLPGTVGGAIYMNSKWTKPISYFGDALFYAYLASDYGKVIKVDRKYFKFDYDYSILQKTREIVLEIVFRLKKVSPKILEKRAQEAFEHRLKTQPFGVATSGCFFKNPGSTSAGYLIDKAGLKGYSVGNFIVSDKHANFIINKGNGKSEDLKKLISLIKSKVKEKFGVELEKEVIVA
ncbi:UDP-N-acetylmuramate--L-alanine ligase [Candidatus Roizmanbacteria bacterium]|nr:UDP-N-acetylmuramate--L-alanine ligase [Candidatus Roizmanbacteria bacterium]